MSCQVFRNTSTQEIEKVMAPNNKESILYNSILKEQPNKEEALKLWAQVYTPSFKEWFGNSKVVDSNNEPILKNGVVTNSIGETRGLLNTVPVYKPPTQENIDPNKVKYTLKSVEVAQTPKAISEWNKLQKGTISFEQFLNNAQFPKEQKELLKEIYEKEHSKTLGDLVTSLVSTYAYVVEINTAKERGLKNQKKGFDLTQDPDTGRWVILNFRTGIPKYFATKEDAEKYIKGEVKETPTQHYSNMTVPGGTNYTENEIATPNIVPSIKGHAQFSTDNGIMWERSDDKVKTIESWKKSEEAPTNWGIEDAIYKLEPKTRRIQEFQSDFAQKIRNNFTVDGKTYTRHKGGNGEWVYSTDKKTYETAFQKYLNTPENSKDAFLKLLLRDDNWIAFGIKAITQNYAKKGYDKIWWPTGDTASKVEGHETLEQFKKQKEERVIALTERKNNLKIIERESSPYKWGLDSDGFTTKYLTKEDAEFEMFSQIKSLNKEIDTTKEELKRVETEGLAAFNPIYDFYENRIKNILDKTYGKDNIERITDEHGSSWYQLTLDQKRDQSEIYLQKEQETAVSKPSKADKDSIKIFNEFSTRLGITEKQVHSIIIDGKKIKASGAAFGLKDLNGIVTKGVIEYLKGKELEAKPEEIMHIAVMILESKNSKLLNEMLSKISKFSLYDKVYQEYKNDPAYQIDGKPNVVKIKKEAVAKLLVEFVINQSIGNNEKQENLVYTMNWWDKVKAFINELLNKIGISQLFKANDAAYKEVANQVISGKFEGTVADINTKDRYSQLGEETILGEQEREAFKKEHTQQTETLDSIQDMLNDHLVKTDKTEDNPSGYLFDGQKVKESATMIVKKENHNNTSFENNRTNQLQAQFGNAYHSVMENIGKRYTDSDGFLKPIADPADPKDYSFNGFILDPVKGKLFYNKMEAFLADKFKSFPKGTRFKFEVAVANGIKEAATIDMLVVTPDGDVHILDWKTSSKDVTKYDDISHYNAKDWNLQANVQKRILKNAYGIGVKTASFQPFRVVLLIDPEKAELQSIELPDLDLKMEGRDYLLPYYVPGSVTGDVQVDRLLDKLNKLYDYIQEHRATEGRGDIRIAQMENLMKAIRYIWTKQSVAKTVDYINSLTVELSLLSDRFDGTKFKVTSNSTPIENLEQVAPEAVAAYLDEIRTSMAKFSILEEEDAILAFYKDTAEEGQVLKALYQAKQEYKKITDIASKLLAKYGSEAYSVKNLESAEANYRSWWGQGGNASRSQTSAIELYDKIRRDVFIGTDIEKTKQLHYIQAMMKKVDLTTLQKLMLVKEDGKYTNKRVSKYAKQFYEEFEQMMEVYKAIYFLPEKSLTNELRAKMKSARDWFNKNIDIQAYEKWAQEKMQVRIDNINNYVWKNDAIENAEVKQKMLENLYREFAIDKEGHIDQTQPTLFNYKLKRFATDSWFSDEYTKLAANKDVKEFYDYIDSLVEKAYENDLLQSGARHNWLPWVSKGAAMGVISSLTEAPASKKSKKDALTGETILTANMPYTSEIANPSLDIYNNLGAFMSALLVFEKRQQLIPLYQSLIAVEAAKAHLETTKQGKIIEGKEIPGNEENAKLLEEFIRLGLDETGVKNAFFQTEIGRVGESTATRLKKLNKLTEQVGVNVAPEGIEDRVFTVSSIANGLNAFNRLRILAGSLIIPTTNLIGGNLHNFIRKTNLFSKTDYLHSLEVVMSGYHFGTTQDKKLRALKDILSPSTEGSNHLQHSLKAKSWKTIFSKDTVFILMKKGHMVVEDAGAMAILKNTIVVDGKTYPVKKYVRDNLGYAKLYYEAKDKKAVEKQIQQKSKELLETKGILNNLKETADGYELEGIDRRELSTLVSRIKDVARKATGAAELDNKGLWSQNILYRSATFLKDWVFPLADIRFGNLKMETGSGDYELGRYRAFGRMLLDNKLSALTRLKDIIQANEKGQSYMQQEMQRRIEKHYSKTGKKLEMTKEQYMDMYRDTIKSAAKDLLVAISLITAWAIVKGMKPPADELDKAHNNYWNTYVKLLDKFSDELSFFISPLSAQQLIKGSILPAVGPIADMEKAVYDSFKYLYAEQQQDDKMIKKLHLTKDYVKLVPYANQFQFFVSLLAPDNNLGMRVNPQAMRTQ